MRKCLLQFPHSLHGDFCRPTTPSKILLFGTVIAHNSSSSHKHSRTFAPLVSKGDQTSPAACRPLGCPKCFKATRAMVSTLFVVQYFGERKRDRPSRRWNSASPGSFLPITGKKVKTLRVYGLRVFKIFQRSLRRLEGNWLVFVKLEDTWERVGFSDWCFKLKMWE